MVRNVRRFRIGRASELIGVERWRLKSWCAKGWVPHEKTDGGHIRFSMADIEDIRKAVEFDAK
jgi:DNA-binding transcriptional MerR regulator